jgi:AraC-like DNA-binding protein
MDFSVTIQDMRKFLHNPIVVDDLTFLATTRQPHCAFRLDKHLIGYYTLQFITDGTLSLAYDDRWFALETPSFFPAYPGPRLRFWAESGATWFHRHVGFQGPRVAHWIAEGLWPTEPQSAPPEMEAAARFDELIGLARRDDLWGRRLGTNRLEGLLIELAERRVQGTGSSDFLTHVLSELERDAFAPDYERIARDRGLGIATLRRRFKASMGGQTLHGYVIQQRIARVRALLVETDLPLREIAQRTGYETEHYLARQFRLVAGVTPGAYRRSRLFVPASEKQ